MSRRPHSSLLLVFFLLALPCLLLWRVVFMGEAFVPADLLHDIAPWRSGNPADLVSWNPLMWDGVAEFYPWRAFAAASLRAGRLPLWNPHQFCGTPFVANSQSAVFYPLNLLFLILPVASAFGVSVLLHLFLTGLFLYGFLRSAAFGLSRPAALLGAEVWQMSTWQVSWLALPTFLCVSSWLPLCLWLTYRLIERPIIQRATALGVCLGLMLLAGHLQIALYCLGLTAAYAIFLVWKMKAPLTVTLRTVALSGVALALMAAFVAPQLLPALELSRVSHRAGGTVGWASYQNYLKIAFPAFHLVTLILPGFFGNPTLGTYWGATNYAENACYMGVVGLLLALFGIGATWRSQSTTRFFAVSAVIALLMALGTPLDALLYFGLPGFAQSGSPGRILVLWTFCGAVLAAIGADRLTRREDGRRLDRAFGASFGALLLALALMLGDTVFWVQQNAPAGTLEANLGRETDLWRLPAGMLLAALAVWWLYRRGTVSGRFFRVAIVVLAAVDLLAVNVGYNRSAPPAQVYPVTPGIAFLQRHAGYERIMPLNKRWSLYQPPPAVLPPNAATVYGLYDTQGYDSLLTRRYIEFAGRLNGGQGSPAPPENGNMVFTNGYTSPQAQEAAARFLVSWGELPPETGLKKVRQDGQMYIYANRKALPRVRLLSGRDAAIIAVSPTQLTIRVDNGGQNDALVVADQWYPGWQVWIDGAQATIEPAPDVFRTVQLAAAGRGPRTVEMRYWPTTFRVGMYALCIALGVTAGVLVSSRGRCRSG